MEAHWSIRLVEQYHAVLQRAYKVIIEDLQDIISKKTTLQMAVKAVNNTASPDNLVSILLIFEVYLRMYSIDPPALSTIQ